MLKIPVFNNDNEVISIYTKSEDVTDSINLLELLDMYIYIIIKTKALRRLYHFF